MRFVEVSPGQIDVRDGPRPGVSAGWGRVRVEACGVCGTDLHLFEGMRLPRGVAYPVRPGHEVAGVLLDGGDDRVGPGDRVVLHPVLPCGACAACAAGRENQCRTAGVLGIDHAGGLADEIAWPTARIVPVPGVPPERAAVLPDAVASAHHALRLTALPRGGSLTVVGAGGVGAHVLQLARVLDPDARLTAVVRSTGTADRIERLGLGVAVVGGGLDGAARRVLEASGPQDAVVEYGAGAAAAAEALPMLARGGRLVLGSVGEDELVLGTTLTTLVTRELRILGSYASTLADLEAVAELVLAGRLDLSESVSHLVPLAEAERAIRLLAERPPGLARVVVTP
jgi:D-arabinose 1-dehydrogenase-like Zn-dependent alcohol dehydrogenase